MFRLESNAEGVLLRLMNKISRAEDDLQENLREAAHDGLALIANRIQQRGQGQNGQRLRTKARKRVGAYSAYYAGKRAAAGRQVDRVDLTNTGRLFADWKVLSSSARRATGGFDSVESADKAEYLEDYYGPIFGLSPDEQAVVVGGVEERIHVTLNQ